MEIINIEKIMNIIKTGLSGLLALLTGCFSLMLLGGCGSTNMPSSGGGANITPPLARPAVPQVIPGQQFSLQSGAMVNIANTPYNLRFVRVVTDSRCPAGRQCIWQGVGTIELQLTGGGANSLLTLDTLSTGRYRSSKDFPGHQVGLVSLQKGTPYIANLLVNKR